MTLIAILSAIAIYVAVILLTSRVVTRRNTNDAFFRGNRTSPWWAVAFGMIGASLSGVSLVSVPGMVLSQDMTYMPMCIGFFFGYLVVSYALLPLYYRLQLTSIYSYLNDRFGKTAHRTGALFFFVSKMLGASLRLYLACLVLQQAFHDAFPFWLTTLAVVFFIWYYTRKGGVRTLVWTDVFQTAVLLIAVVMIAWQLCRLCNFSFYDAAWYIADSSYSHWWEWDDWMSPRHALKQFLSGVFIVVVMTGLDQDMMQKNLTCKSLRDAQKDMTSYGLFFIPLNLLLLSVGVLATAFYIQSGLDIPSRGDDLLPFLIHGGFMGQLLPLCFLLGIMAVTFSSADSAMTALTTSCCVDLLDVDKKPRYAEQIRRCVHAGVALAMAVCILLFSTWDNSSVIDAIYVMASYSYGPLLGLYAFGLFIQRKPQAEFVPLVCLAAPVFCWAISSWLQYFLAYTFGYELLLLNGLLTFIGLWIFSRRK